MTLITEFFQNWTLKTRTWSGLAVLLTSTLTFGSFADSPDVVESREIIEGTRLENYQQELKVVFPEATRIEEYTFLPREWGGITLMGLIGRLVGSRAEKPYEGIDTRRYLYRAFKGKEVLGIAHGSSIKATSQTIDIFAYYDANGTVKDIRIDKAPASVLSKLSSGGYLKQFLNRPAGDFSVIIGRRARVVNWGKFSAEARRPQDQEAKAYYNAILRSMRFNTAFVEIAYFIGQNSIAKND